MARPCEWRAESREREATAPRRAHGELPDSTLQGAAHKRTSKLSRKIRQLRWVLNGNYGGGSPRSSTGGNARLREPSGSAASRPIGFSGPVLRPASFRRKSIRCLCCFPTARFTFLLRAATLRVPDPFGRTRMKESPPATIVSLNQSRPESCAKRALRSVTRAAHAACVGARPSTKRWLETHARGKTAPGGGRNHVTPEHRLPPLLRPTSVTAHASTGGGHEHSSRRGPSVTQSAYH